MKIDKVYFMSSFLQFRTIFYEQKAHYAEPYLKTKNPNSLENERKLINDSSTLHKHLIAYMHETNKRQNVALALSGGMDSAIGAKLMPKGSTAYTFKCLPQGKGSINEEEKARLICKINGLIHRIIEITWDDYIELSSLLMNHKNAPIHSIEVQIYKAALQAKKDGFNCLVFGEPADIIYGGFNRILSQDYTIGKFVDRYSFVMPHHVLKNFIIITEPFKKHTVNGLVNVHEFLNEFFLKEAIESYINPCDLAGIQCVFLYGNTWHNPLDLERVRRGESKYIIRDLFKKLYPELEIPVKIPLPRSMDEWLSFWEGPTRPEFWENSHLGLTGDQKYYVWILEKFLNDYDDSNDTKNLFGLW